MSQPHVIATGPPLLNAMKYEVRQPARIEMIVKLIAKFWNPPIARNSSWAYPILWRICSSSEVWIAPGAGAGVSLMPPP